MNAHCRDCQIPFDQHESDGQAVRRCPSCGVVCVSSDLLRILVRQAATLAGVARTTIGLIETAPQPITGACPLCGVVSMSQLGLRGIVVARCGRCSSTFLQHGDFAAIVRRVVEAERGWALEEADWHATYRRVKGAGRSSYVAAGIEGSASLLGLITG